VLVGFNGTNRSGIVRLNQTGSLDTNFIHGPGTDAVGSYVGSIAVQTDEKILIGGRFKSFDGIGRTNLARLNPDGTLDTGFTAPGITLAVAMIALQPDDKILTVTTNLGLQRLNADGSTDTNFTASFRYISALAVSADGSIYVAGGTNAPRSDVFRLNPDGSLDSTFDPVILGTNSPRINSIALEPDGLSLLLAGQFASVNGVPRTSLARVFTVQQPGLTRAEFVGGNYRFLLSGETGRAYRIDASTNLLDWLTLSTVALTNSTHPFVDTNALRFERRFYRGVVVTE